MDNEYLTIFEAKESKIEVKKSVFVAAISPVDTEEDALKFLNDRRKIHNTANHNVYAYRINSKESSPNLQRYSDDGEPSGTSALPVLNILNGRKLSDTIVVVSRYFGGTLLGTGGLVHAYSLAATTVIEEAGVAKIVPYIQYKIKLDYTNYNIVEDRLMRSDFIVVDREYLLDVSFTVDVKVKEENIFLELINELTKQQARLIKLGLVYKKIKN